MKKFYFLSLMLALALQATAQVWDGAASTTWTNGDGSENNPYLIETPAQLAYLSAQVGSGNAFAGKYFRQMNDLNMGDKEFPVIGKYDKSTDSQTQQTVDNSCYFKGTFDGNHKTIDHLLITKAPEATGSIGGQPVSLGGVALFACSTEGTVIKNITIGKNSKIAVDGEVVGSIIGKMEGGLLENCINLSPVSASTIGGGLVGATTDASIIRYCANKGTVTLAGMVCGGIVGQTEKGTTIQACYNTGTVTSNYVYCGGIVGLTFDNSVVKNCYNTGKVTGVANFLGKPHAIIGENDGGKAISADNYYVKELSNVDDPLATDVTEAELKANEILEKLNKNLDAKSFVADSKNQNNGFPVFAWEQGEVTGVAAVQTSADIALNGRSISGAQSLTIYDLSGRIVAKGTNITLSKGGIYLISAPKQPTLKVVVK